MTDMISVDRVRTTAPTADQLAMLILLKCEVCACLQRGPLS